MLAQIALTFALFVGLMAFWFAVQHGVRRSSPELEPGCDVLDGRLGCHGCVLGGRCDLSKAGDQSPRP